MGQTRSVKTGKPPMKRQAAKLVSKSNTRQDREPEERGHLVDTMPNPNSRTEIGARLVLTRKALDYTQATMAGLMGVDG